MSSSNLTIDAEPPKTPALGQRASRGMVWMVGQTLLSKLVSVGGQIVMAWLLLPKEYGLVTLAYAVAAFPALIRDAGLQFILVQRHSHFRRWAGPVFWMSMFLGLAASALMCIAAPIAAHAWRAPGLTGLVLVLAASTPLGALSTVPAAKVQADLRFRFQAVLALVIATAMVVLNILFALLHFGPYAFILPYAITTVARTVILWLAAPVPVGWNLHLRRWKYLVKDSGIILASLFFATLLVQGDYLTLGFVKDAQVVGIFYFAFNLSTQTYTVLTQNVGSIFFPALSKLTGEPKRQMDGFLNAARVFALISIPLCFLQGALSDPGIKLLFSAKWYPSIHILEVLSITMGIRSALVLAQSLAAAQGRWGIQFLASIISSLFFLSVVAVCAVLGGSQAGLTVAFGELFVFALSDGAFFYLMVRLNGHGVKDLLEVLSTPVIFSAVSVGMAVFFDILVGRKFQVGPLTLPIRMAAISIIAIGGYAVLLRFFAASAWGELTSRLRMIRSRS